LVFFQLTTFLIIMARTKATLNPRRAPQSHDTKSIPSALRRCAVPDGVVTKAKERMLLTKPFVQLTRSGKCYTPNVSTLTRSGHILVVPAEHHKSLKLETMVVAENSEQPTFFNDVKSFDDDGLAPLGVVTDKSVAQFHAWLTALTEKNSNVVVPRLEVVEFDGVVPQLGVVDTVLPQLDGVDVDAVLNDEVFDDLNDKGF
jgi:hypothetical protein